MNEDYYHEQNSCYDPNSFGFDQFQPPQYTVNHLILNAQNDLFNSQNKLMEQLTFMCDMILIYYDDDDDEDYTIAITPILSTEEPDNSLSMRDEHLDTIPATKSDEFIKSSVENLVPIPSESEGNPGKMCDVPFHDNSPPLDVSKDQFEDFFDSNDDSTSIDDDYFYINNIEYVEASSLDSELVSSEELAVYINTLSWDCPTICYNDDDDEDCTIAITPILSTKEPDNSLSMGDKHLDTILATESDEDNSLPLDILKDQFEEFSDSNDDSTSIDDDSLSIDDIKYVEASPPNSELVSLEVVEIVISKVRGIDDIFF
nr:hypothetical protein [Tanacetum cinerariifolium]